MVYQTLRTNQQVMESDRHAVDELENKLKKLHVFVPASKSKYAISLATNV